MDGVYYDAMGNLIGIEEKGSKIVMIIDQALEMKHLYNTTRPYKHGGKRI